MEWARCAGSPSGKLYVDVDGGIPGYTYQWSGEDSTYFSEDPVDVYAGYGWNTGSQTVSLGTEAEPAAYGTATIPSTGNWANFLESKVGEATFTTAGPQTVRITYGGGLNLDWFSFDF